MMCSSGSGGGNDADRAEIYLDQREQDDIEMSDTPEPECLAPHCPPGMFAPCEWPRCANPNLIP